MCAKLSLPEQRVQDVHDRLGNVFRIGRVDSSEVSPFRAMSGTPVWVLARIRLNGVDRLGSEVDY
jgi:hypothetical protein